MVWNKGKKCPQLSKALKDRKLTKKHRENITKGNIRRYKEHPELKGQISKKLKGIVGTWKDRKRSLKTRRVMSESQHKRVEQGRHNNYKGGITPLRKQIRECFKYRQWRSDVFTRDDFTCQECRARSGNGKAVYLEADHYPKSFANIIEEYKIKSLEEALNCEEL